MQYIAEAKNIRMSARKVRLVADAVRGKSISYALTRLNVLDQRASLPIKKTIESAISNAVNNFSAKRDNLVLKSIIINEGTALKRYHYAARGRVRPYKRRSSHIRIVLADIKGQNEGVKEKSETEVKTGIKEKGVQDGSQS